MPRSIITTAEIQKAILSGVLNAENSDDLNTNSNTNQRINRLLTQLKLEHFTHPYDIIYKIVQTYFAYTASVVSKEHFINLVEQMGLADNIKNEILIEFVNLKDCSAISETEFRYQVMLLRDKTKNDMFVETLVDTMDVLRLGKKVDNKYVHGYEPAVALLNERLTRIDLMATEGVSTLQIDKDVGRVLRDYADRKYGRKSGLLTGWEIIDAETGGLQAGDLVFIAGYTSEGKTSLVLSLADFWAFTRKANIVIATAEHPPWVTQRKMVAIRSADRKYGFQEPLSAKRLKMGHLNAMEERQLETVVQDMNTDKYGKVAIFMMPPRSKVSGVFQMIKNINQMFKVDVFIWDYIKYGRAEVERKTDREAGTHLILETKVECINFDGGRGIPVVSPFQVARHRWEKACDAGMYTLACMEETSESEKASDIVWSLLRLEQPNKTVGQLLKNRDGPRVMAPFDMEFDAKSVRFVPKSKLAGSL